jgi:D-alanyl-D-alanine carboxypeptidase (penicillin-binding protein 5/6)
MMTFARSRERLVPLLFFFVALLVAALGLVSVALAETGGTTTKPQERLVQELSLKATDLGIPGGTAPRIDSPAAVLVSLKTGHILFEHNAKQRMRMASTTKIMTAVLVLEKMDLAAKVTISAKAAATYEPKYWVRKGDVFTVDELLYALLLRSANAAAVALAEACSGSVDAFVQEMNRKAAELGMHDTHFTNPHGLDDDGHYSTAADMAVLGRYAMQDERFRKYVATREYELELPGRGPLLLTNTNKLLHEYPWVIGVKTGLTPKAEQCLVAAGRRDGVEVLSVVLGQPVSDLCFQESKQLLEYGFGQCRDLVLLQRGAVLGEATAPYGLEDPVRLVAAEGVTFEAYGGDEIETSIAADKALELPVVAGQPCGQMQVKVNGEVVKVVPLVADKPIAVPTLGTKLKYGFIRLGRWLAGIF